MRFYNIAIIALIAIVGGGCEVKNKNKECLEYSTTYIPIYGKTFFLVPRISCIKWKEALNEEKRI